MTDARTTGRVGDPPEPSAGSFGPNAWLVEDMYDRFLLNPSSVGESWREFFAGYRPGPLPASRVAADAPPAANGAQASSAAPVSEPHPPTAEPNGAARAAIDASSAPVEATPSANGTPPAALEAIPAPPDAPITHAAPVAETATDEPDETVAL